ncbi:MAG: HAD-IIIA family hydrolase [SAR324 cluster bacterium]|nr:HAD-IIIA family hydrolase [SAR324 cluster bacterium]
MKTADGRPAPIFLDRDGTLIEEVDFLSSLKEMRLLPGAAAAVRAANRAGHPVIVVTNQSGVARGYFSEAFVQESGAHLRGLLGAAKAHLDGYYYCPYHPDGLPPYNLNHPDRKPGAGMILRARKELGLNLGGGWIIGDRPSDLDTGAEHGLVPLLVRTGYGQETEKRLGGDFHRRGGRVFDALADAVRWVLTKK